jgi:D-beta-D-heptose 7-phosphate kinase/D-beta-D-heptose 1-phosphate adenosyltransferase
MKLYSSEGEHTFASSPREVYDVSGAGDTVIATFAASMCAGFDALESARRANAAAGIVVGKVGTYPVSLEELDEALGAERHRTDKVCSLDEAMHKVAFWRGEGRRVVFTNGCFDLLHAGHVLLFQEARKLGDRLIVAMNSDASVRRIKGTPRPILHEKERVQILSALEHVDMLLVFDEDEPVALIESIRPDVLAKGSDYAESEVVGADLVTSYGGEVALVPVLENTSVSEIMKKLRGAAR